MKTKPAVTHRVPDSAAWEGYKDDLDVRSAHDKLFGRNLDEVQRYFGGVQSISRADELLFMPRRAFQYYVLAFAQFVLSEQAKDDPDSASPFLRLLVAREERDPGSVRAIYADLEPVVAKVASQQAYYDATREIYGNFHDHEVALRNLCAAA